MRHFASPIEADLRRYYRADVLDWWRGAAGLPASERISTRRMLTWINELPEESATKTEMRNGDWTQDRYIAARIANELMMRRADAAAAIGISQNHTLIQSPWETYKRDIERFQARHVHDMIHAQISGQVVLPPRAVSITRETDIDQKRRAREELIRERAKG